MLIKEAQINEQYKAYIYLEEFRGHTYGPLELLFKFFRNIII